MNNKNAMTFGILSLVVTVGVLGFIGMEFLANSNQNNIREQQVKHEEIKKDAPAIVKEALNKALSAENITITDTEKLDIIGCAYTSTYIGQKKGQEEFAHNEVSTENNAIIADICPKSQDTLINLYNLQIYWTQDKVYKKSNTDTDFVESTPEERQFLEKPSNYLSKYFKAYKELPSLKYVDKENNILTVTYTDKEDKTETDYTLKIEVPNTLKKITYAKKTESSLGTDTGTITLDYTSKEVKPESFLTGETPVSGITDQIKSLDNNITVQQDANTFIINGKYKSLYLNAETKDGKQKGTLDCEIQTQECYTKYQKAVQTLINTINASKTPITTGECTKLRAYTKEQINDQNRIMRLTLQKATETSSYTNKTEIEIDTVTGKTVVTKYGTNFTCYETEIPKPLVANLFDALINQIGKPQPIPSAKQ